MITLALNILDIVQNSIRAEADQIGISIEESVAANTYSITIADNGKGISPDILHNVTEPFVTTRTKRKMGMGLPLLRYHAELTGGGVKIRSEQGKGTTVIATFTLNHLDRQPLGDITGVLMILIAANPGIDFRYDHRTDSGEYIFDTAETRQYLEIDNLNDMTLLEDLKSMIQENLTGIEASGIQIKTI
jgi:DNA mismatch repair ATPase MutL